jgi:hypothetical protein
MRNFAKTCLSFDPKVVRVSVGTSTPCKSFSLERLSARATETNIRLTLANDYLYKVDTASMRKV